MTPVEQSRETGVPPVTSGRECDTAVSAVHSGRSRKTKLQLRSHCVGILQLLPSSAKRCWSIVLLLSLCFASLTQASEPAVTPIDIPVVEKPTFHRDILPIFAKAGCSAGSCHAKAEGQNGFGLSVFSYDPFSDFKEIVHDARGRRIFPAAPAQSLLLLKATREIPHEGGKRFEPGSPAHQTFVRWIEQGMPYEAENEAPLEAIHVSPPDARYAKNSTKQLKVEAQFADGSKRDVTALSEFVSQSENAAAVTPQGLVTAGSAAGEATIIVRYLDLVDVARVNIPPDSTLPKERYTGLPVKNEIDRYAYERYQTLGLLPSATCSDSEFIRRASLDTLGRLPDADQVRKFLADKSPDKRTKLVDLLLADDVAWGDYWATKYNDLLRPNTQRVGIKPVMLMDQWVRQQLLDNVPWDQFVRDLLTAEGSSHEFGPIALMRDKREPADFAEFTSRIFLGIRMDCAKCHHHPSEQWSQDDYYSMAAFFSSLKRKGQGISPPISGEKEVWWFQPGATVKHPVSQAVMTPKAPGGPEFPEIPEDTDPRAVLVDWMTSKDNPYFAHATVNRVWGELFGRGIVHPVDDFRASNPASNQPLLDWLAADFAKNGYDLKKLVRTIMQSNLYQLSSLPNDTNLADTANFSRSYRRRLPAEVLDDAVSSLIGDTPKFSGLPAGSPAMRAWNNLLGSDFLDAFGRPDSSAECPCERDRSSSVVQALHLMNSRDLHKRMASDKSVPALLAKPAKKGETVAPEKIIEDIYLATYARPPVNEELEIAKAHFAKKDLKPEDAARDLLWSLINSAEFVFNH